MVLCVAAVALSGCGGSTSSASSATRAYLGTQAPGDYWNWSIKNGTFTATDNTLGYTYSGTETMLSTGFLKLVVQATTDPGVTVGQAAYAIELPDTALIVKPAGADTRPPIVACALGSNPAGPTVTYNYVVVPSTTWTIAKAACGDVTFAVTGDTYAGTKSPFDINGNPLTQGSFTFTCVGGRMTDPNGTGGVTYNGAMTPSGVCVIDYGPKNGGIIGVQQPSANVDEATLASQSYRGFLIKQGVTECCVATPNGDGTLSGKAYTEPNGVETGTFQGGESGVTASFGTQLEPGLVEMNIVTSGGSETIMCCVSVVGGKTMLLGFGDGGGSNPYNIMFVQK
jgi:hypothetical protein